MSAKLRDLIKSVRACKTAAEERAVITKESALVRSAFAEGAADYQHRNVAKVLYMHMLGYSVHWAQLECIKLIASASFAEKRIGYLALSLIIDERAEVLTLVTNSIQNDLKHANQFVVGLALAALGNIASAEMARDLANDVDRQLKSANPYVRKKAALCTIRLLRKVPELVDTFVQHIVILLTDKNHNVLLTGVTLVTVVAEVSPEHTAKFARLVPALVKILRKLLQAGFAPEYDVGGVTDPFLQAKILYLLRVLGRGNAEASEAMNGVLAQVATNTETHKNAGNAVLYECVNTIMAVESESGLRVLAVNTLGKFLGSRDPNVKYVALETLSRVIHLDAEAVQRHRAVIVECLRDADVSIRRRALDLTYALINATNVRELVRELLGFLAVADPDARPDLCTKVAAAATRFAPTPRWHIDVLISMLAAAGNSAKREAVSQAVFLISHATGADAAALAHKLFAMLAAAVAPGAPEAQQPMLQVAVWCVGERGELLTAAPPPAPGADDVGPLGEQRSEAELLRALERLALLYYAAPETKAMALTAALKLTARLREPGSLARLRAVLARFRVSGDVELQQRSLEFAAIAEPGRVPALEADGRRAAIVDPIPLLEAAVLRKRLGAAGAGGGGAGAGAGGDDDDGGDEVEMEVLARGTVKGGAPATAAAAPAPPAPAAPAAAAAASSLLDLDDLFSSVSAAVGQGDDLLLSSAAPAATSAAAVGAPVMAAAPAPPPPAFAAPALSRPAPASSSSAPLADALAGLDDLLGGGPPAPAPFSAVPAAPARPAAPAPAAAAAAAAAAGTLGAAAARSAAQFDAVFGAATPAPPSSTAMGSLFGSPAPAPAPAAASFPSFSAPSSPAVPAPAAAAAAAGFLAFESPHPGSGLRVHFACEAPAPLAGGGGATDIRATFTVAPGGGVVSGLVCQAAVPKSMRVTLQPASGAALGAGGPAAVTQALRLENSQAPAKPAVVKLRITYRLAPAGGGPAVDVVDQGDVRNFPAGV